MSRFVFSFITLVNLFTAATEAKTLVVNIGLECKGCKLGTMKGVPADLKFFKNLATQMGAHHTITIDETKWAELGGKSSVLNKIREAAKAYENVVFNYTGHGLPVPLKKNAVNKPIDPKFRTADFEIAFIGEEFAKCFDSIRFDDPCTKLCSHPEGIKPGCNAQLELKQTKCNEGCFSEYYQKKTTHPETSFSHFVQCSQRQCNHLSEAMTKICDANSLLRNTCELECRRKDNNTFYSVFIDRFENPQLNSCLAQSALLRSDLEGIFAGKRFYALIDSCYSGLMLNFNRGDAVIAAASTAMQLARDGGAKGGDFLVAKSEQLRRDFCERDITLEEFLLSSPHLSFQTPQAAVLSNGGPESRSKLQITGLPCTNQDSDSRDHLSGSEGKRAR